MCMSPAHVTCCSMCCNQNMHDATHCVTPLTNGFTSLLAMRAFPHSLHQNHFMQHSCTISGCGALTLPPEPLPECLHSHQTLHLSCCSDCGGVCTSFQPKLQCHLLQIPMTLATAKSALLLASSSRMQISLAAKCTACLTLSMQESSLTKTFLISVAVKEIECIQNSKLHN